MPDYRLQSKYEPTWSDLSTDSRSRHADNEEVSISIEVEDAYVVKIKQVPTHYPVPSFSHPPQS